MKQLPKFSGEQWDNHLFEDLVFIKKHKRYPIKRMTLMPLLGLVFMLPAIIATGWSLYIHHNNANIYQVILIVTLAILLPFSILLKRYFDLISFKEIKSIFTLNTNLKLVEQFLKEQQLLVVKHPLAPEIFQIISKNIDAFGEVREVLIFVADEQRILMNSHFTTSRKKTSFFIPPTNQKEMMQLFTLWLQGKANNVESTALMR